MKMALYISNNICTKVKMKMKNDYVCLGYMQVCQEKKQFSNNNNNSEKCEKVYTLRQCEIMTDDEGEIIKEIVK